MKNKAPQPNEDAPRKVVAVQSLTPEFCVYNAATGTLRRVIGGNVQEQSVYLEGVMPKVFRMAAEDGNYEHELIFEPLPNTIEELVLAENPECQLVLTDCKVIEINPKPEPAMCKVIEHPAVKFAKPKPKASKPPVDPNQTKFPFAENDYSPIEISA